MKEKGRRNEIQYKKRILKGREKTNPAEREKSRQREEKSTRGKEKLF